MLKIDMNYFDEEVINHVFKSDEYKKADEKLTNILDTLERKEMLNVDSAVTHILTTVIESTYQKAFHDGMNFILNTMNGKKAIGL